ncbi:MULTISPECIES: YqjF family protein [unclassified Modestobacter]
MADPEPSTPTSPRPVQRGISTQGWRDLAFLHWAVDPAVVAPLLPAGTVPDVHEGATYVGLVPFRMWRIGMFGSPGLPWLGTFAETNVRLYSVDAAGRRGVVFRSLDAERLLPVLAARWVARLPYLWSRMRVERAGDRVRYTSARRWPGPRPAESRIELRIGAPLTGDDPLARFLTARWGLHRPGRRGPVYWPNEHPEWPLWHAELVSLEESLLAAAGLPGITGAPDSVLFSPGVDVRFGPLLR